uniref:Putative secreted protein n=1 Tax=Ixodes scapularis TaxID=6945 RepID=A0A4D5RC72_IXOSC
MNSTSLQAGLLISLCHLSFMLSLHNIQSTLPICIMMHLYHSMGPLLVYFTLTKNLSILNKWHSCYNISSCT